MSKSSFDIPYRFNKINRVVVMLINTSRNCKMFGSKIISSGGKSIINKNVVGISTDPTLRSSISLANFIERHHDYCCTISANQFRLFDKFLFLLEIELTMPLPCIHFRPASITSHFEESTITAPSISLVQLS